MNKKLLITGSGGFVAGSVMDQAKNDWEVHAVGRRKCPPDTSNLKYHQLDLLETAHVTQLFHDINPDAVIHTAAIADIDFCENNRITAEKVNTGITELLAGLCSKNGVKMVFCSTDNVFNGEKGFYKETDEPDPVNFYGETKLKGERAVELLGKNGVVARLALVMGLPVMGKGNSFLAVMMEKLKKGERMNFAVNEIRTPVDVITLGRALLELADNDYSGIMHLGGRSRLTRFEMARKIAEKLGYSPELIHPVNSAVFKNRAPRPADVSMVHDRAEKELKTPMLSLEEGLDLVLNYKKDG